MFDIAALALIAISVSLAAFFAFQSVNQSIRKIRAETDTASLADSMRTESLKLTDLVRQYTLQLSSLPELKVKISIQQLVLNNLLDLIASNVELDHRDQLTRVDHIRQFLFDFSVQASKVVEVYDSEKTVGPETTLASDTLANTYQVALQEALLEFEQFQRRYAEERQYQAEQMTQWILFVLAFIVIGVVVAVIFMLRNLILRVAQPLAELRDGVEEFRRGNLDSLIRVQSQDEVGRVAEAFNTLSSEVRKSRAQVEEYTRSLEAQVAERTQEAEQRASQAAAMSELAQARSREFERLASQAQTAAEISSITSGVLDLEQLLQESVNLIHERFGLLYVALFLSDAERKNVRLRAASGPNMDILIQQNYQIPVDDTSLAGWCICHKQYRIASGASRDTARRPHPLFPDHGSEFALPLISHGEAIGVLLAQIDTVEVLEPAVVTIFQTMAAQLANTITNAQLYQEVQQLAITDSLTGVYNRRYLFEQAQHEYDRVKRYQRSLALIMLDIDHFKQVNDQFGHPVGDEALRCLGRICRSELREIDIVGRYGGEEFLILMPETDENEAMQAAERLRARVAETRIAAKDQDVRLTISLGVAAMNPGVDTSLDDLIKRADDAMYLAKRAGRNRVEVLIS